MKKLLFILALALLTISPTPTQAAEGDVLWFDQEDTSPKTDTAVSMSIYNSNMYVAAFQNASPADGQDASWRIEKRSLTGDAPTAITSNPTAVNDRPWDIYANSTGVYIVGFQNVLTTAGAGSTERIEKRDLNLNPVWSVVLGAGAVTGVTADLTGVYTINRTGVVQKRATFDGNILLWSYPSSGAVSNWGSITSDATGVYIARNNGVIEKIPLTGGLADWTVTGNGKFFNITKVGLDLYVSGHNNAQTLGYLEKRSAATGNMVWPSGKASSNLWLYRGNVSVNSSGIYAVGQLAGSYVWAIEKLDPANGSFNGLLKTEGTGAVYKSSIDSTGLYAVGTVLGLIRVEKRELEGLPCLVGEAKTWTANGNSCSGVTPATNSGVAGAVNDGTQPTTGSASYMCTNGTWATDPEPGATCTITPPASCATNWISRDAAAQNTWNGVTYGNGLFVAVSQDGAQRVMTSPDGITWTERNAPARSWAQVMYDNGLFVAVAPDAVMTSPNGIAWTLQTVPALGGTGWNEVTYGNGLFVGVGSDAVGNRRAMTSPDGVTWVLRNLPGSASATKLTRSVTFGEGLFVALTQADVITSPDGINWTIRDIADNVFWASVTYGNGQFVIHGVQNPGNDIMTSPDGITWTMRAGIPSYLASMKKGYGSGLFVIPIMQPVPTNHDVAVSTDGITWTYYDTPENNSWMDIAYGNNTFVGVAGLGTHRVMTASCTNTEPNLVPSLPTVSTASVVQGGTITLRTNQIRNTGTVVAGPYGIGGFYVDNNGDGVADYTVPAGNITANTAIGGQRSTTTVWTVPLNAPVANNYRISYFADSPNTISETNEGDNFSGWSAPFSVTAAPVADCGTVTDVDGNTYDTVVIGTQCWMKENMNVGSMINGSVAQTNNSTIEKYCYNNQASNCTTNHPNYPDGGLYTWDEAMQYSNVEGAQGICPAGWHIPTDAEWHTLEDYLKDLGQTCDPNRSGGDCYPASLKLRPNGTSNFEGNLTGVINVGGAPVFYGFLTYIWSSTESGSQAFRRSMNTTVDIFGRDPLPKGLGSSVRCVQGGAVPILPDLTATNNTPAAGVAFLSTSAITFTGRAVNSAAAAVPEGGWAGLEIDTNNDGVADDYYAIPDNITQLGSFTPGQTKNLSYTLPANTFPTGSYQYRFNVDSTNLLAESDETNNRSAWRTFTVTVPALSHGGCSIAIGASTCQDSFTWDITGASSPSLYNSTHSLLYSSNAAGTNELYPIRKGNNLIEVRSGATVIKDMTVSADCVGGAIWDGAALPPQCVAIPATPTLTLTATPALVRSGDKASIAVTINDTTANTYNCTVLGIDPAGTANLPTFNHTGTVSNPTSKSYLTKALTSAQIVQVSCTHATLGIQTTKEVRVEVTGTVQEI